MALGTDDGKTACSLNLRRELDIGTTTSHVGGDGYGTQAINALTSLGYDVSLLLVQLGVQYLMRNIAHVEHLAQELRNLYACGTNQYRAACVAHSFNLFDYGFIFFACCLVNTVVEVVASDRAVGRNLYDIEFVDVPEFASLCACGTGHTRQLVVHTEIVLKGDGSEGLSGSLDMHMLLSLDSLMQAVAPTTTIHDTASLLVDNLYLAIHNDIFVVFVEHGVSLEQLLESVHTLTLHAIVSQELILLLKFLLVAKSGLVFESRHLRGDIRQHEEVFIVDLLSQPVGTLVGKVARLLLLVDNEVERFNSLRHTTVVVLHVNLLGLEHTSLDTFFREILDERFVFRQTLV